MEEDDVGAGDHRPRRPGDERLAGEQRHQVEQSHPVEQQRDVTAGDHDRVALRQLAFDRAPLVRDRFALRRSPRRRELGMHLGYPLEMVPIEPADGFHCRVRFAGGEGRGVLLGQRVEFAPRVERMVEPHAVEALQPLEHQLPLPMGVRELRIEIEDSFRARVDRQVRPLAAEATWRPVVLVLFPAGGDQAYRGVERANDGGDRWAVALRPQQGDRRHRVFIVDSSRVVHVIFVEPAFPANQPHFIEALHSVGAAVTAIGEAPFDFLPRRVQERLVGYEQVGSVCDVGALMAAVRRVQARGWVDRLEATVEAHILPTARVRAACGIPGTTEETAFLCRDKPAMKEALRRVGVPCARSTGVDEASEALAFAQDVGYPLIVKPRGGAGAAGTSRVDSDDELRRALAEHRVGAGGTAALEEFIEGHEGFFDTLTIDGEIACAFICHYYPGVLEAMRTRSVSPYLITTNRLHSESYAEVWEMGKKIIGALGIGTSATHQEWFFGPRGYRFSEIGCRPPGVLTWDLYSAANDFDLYREWAHAIVHGRPSAQPSRNYSAALVNFRPDRDGVIVGYTGADEVQAKLGEWILDARLPPNGTPTQPVEAGYMANAWMRIRHPDYDALREMVEWAGRTLRVHASPA